MRFRAHVRWTGDDPRRPEDIFTAIEAADGDAAALAAHAAETGGSHAMPASATSSSKAPQGESS